MEPDPEGAKPLLKPLIKISNKDFRERFGYVSGSWRGKKPIQRNAILALAFFRDKSALEQLIEAMKDDPRPVIRGTAAWAIGKIGGELAQNELEIARLKEKDPEVLEEIEKGLKLAKELV
jgi:epoxyqueuosine reductase